MTGIQNPDPKEDEQIKASEISLATTSCTWLCIPAALQPVDHEQTTLVASRFVFFPRSLSFLNVTE